MNHIEKSFTQQQCGLTFEKDKLALAVLVDGIYLGRQAPPENTDEHGVSWHHRVISHPPKPVVLKHRQRRRLLGNREKPDQGQTWLKGEPHWLTHVVQLTHTWSTSKPVTWHLLWLWTRWWCHQGCHELDMICLIKNCKNLGSCLDTKQELKVWLYWPLLLLFWLLLF